MIMAEMLYFCKVCPHTSPKKFTICPDCGSAGSQNIGQRAVYTEKDSKDRYEPSEKRLLRTFSPKFNDFLGGGLGLGFLVWIGGQPGAGKSTLTLKWGRDWSNDATKVLYVATEEIWEQIKNKVGYLNIKEGPLFKIMETKEGIHVFEKIKEFKPSVVIIDSVSDLRYPVPGSPIDKGGTPAQIKYFTQEIDKYLKNEGILGILICQVTQKGKLSVPKYVEHEADIVIKLYGDSSSEFRKVEFSKIKDQFNVNKVMNFELIKNKGLVEVAPQVKIGSGNESLKEASTDCVYGAYFGDIEYLCVDLEKVTVSKIRSETTKIIGDLIKSEALAKIHKLYEQGVDISGLIVQMPGKLSPEMDLAMVGAVYNYCKDYMLSDKVIMIGKVELTGDIIPIKSDDLLKTIDMKKVMPKGRIIANCNEPFFLGLPVIKVMNIRDLTITLDSIAMNEGLILKKGKIEEKGVITDVPEAQGPVKTEEAVEKKEATRGAIVMGGEDTEQLEQMAHVQETLNATVKLLTEEARQKIEKIQKKKDN
jgi:DNA repair protein RadA/Sms